MSGTDITYLFGSMDEQRAFGNCSTPGCHRAAEGDGMRCKVCTFVAKYDPAALASAQAVRGAKLLRTADTMIRWPLASLDDLTGPLMKGHVNYVVAGSGMGKTTFSYDIVRRWVPAGVGVTVLPLETTPDEWRLSLAAIECGIQHGEMLEIIAAFAEGDAKHGTTLQLVEDMMLNMAADPKWVKGLHVVEGQRITVDALDKAFAVAKAMKHSVVLIDHIDHVETNKDELSGAMLGGTEGIRQVNNAVLTLAKQHQLVVICMSQANQSVQGDGSQPLLRYQKLQHKHVLFNTFKIPNAAQVLGIYRPLKPGLSREQFVCAREGVIPPGDVLAEGRMAVNAMKLRHRGRNEQESVELVYENGQLRDQTEHEREQAALLRSMSSEQFAHSTIAYRQRRGKDGTAHTERGENRS